MARSKYPSRIQIGLGAFCCGRYKNSEQDTITILTVLLSLGSLLWEALWSKHPGRDSPDCTLPRGLRPRLILLQSAVAPNSLWIMQPPKFLSRSDKGHSIRTAVTRDTGYPPCSFRSAYIPKYYRLIHLTTDMNYTKGHLQYCVYCLIQFCNKHLTKADSCHSVYGWKVSRLLGLHPDPSTTPHAYGFWCTILSHCI